MHLKSTTDERRLTATIFASDVLSISILLKRARDNLEEKVSAGILEEMPLVPSLEWVRLQFSPNNGTVKKAIKFTSNIGIKRAIQKRILRKEHEDQHWVNVMTRYVLEWLIELRAKVVPVEFYGGDDKAKIAVGDKEARPYIL